MSGHHIKGTVARYFLSPGIFHENDPSGPLMYHIFLFFASTCGYIRDFVKLPAVHTARNRILPLQKEHSSKNSNGGGASLSKALKKQ
jgi:hypothetical protein